MGKIIAVPFGYLLSWLYQFTGSYGWALIIFTVLVKMILLPMTAKGKKSTMKMSRLSPEVQEIQRKYPNDQQKQNELMQQLYREEGVSMGGGCLWSMLPLLIIFPLYQVVRQPIVYMLHENADVAAQIVEIIKAGAPELFAKNNYYDQMIAAQQIPYFAETIKAAIPGISEAALAGVNLNFLGLDLGAIAQFNIFNWSAYDWAHIGLFLLPVLAAGSQLLATLISQKMNNSVVTDKDGIQDKETADKSQANQTMKTMMWSMPLMSLWFGFTIPAALSLYWLIQSVVSTVQDVILTGHLRKVYDAEDAVRLQRRLEREKEEAEKERVRAERRAANPDGITTNTSKKKLQQKQRDQEQAAKAAAAKEYAAKKGELVEDETEEVMSGIPERPYCKGRNYNPNRYSHHNTEE